MAIQQAQSNYKDSLDLPLAEVHVESTRQLKKIETRVRDVWVSQGHYTPERVAPEFETFPAYQERLTESKQPSPDIPDLSYRQMKRLKAHTRTNFFVGVAFGTSLMAIVTLMSGMMR